MLRRKGRKNGFNPELMTLVTEAMEEPPETPGGEPIDLGDLVILDPQVTYGNAASRVTRLKLFRVLEAVRTYRRSRGLDEAEPALRDPSAIVRRPARPVALVALVVSACSGATSPMVRRARPALRRGADEVRRSGRALRPRRHRVDRVQPMAPPPP